MTQYSIRVAWSDPDEMFVAVCPELGDLSALGASQHEAVAELEQAIELALETYEAEGWHTPAPGKIEEYSGQFRLRLPKSLHAWLSHEAERQSTSLNALVAVMLSQARGTAETRAVVVEEVRSALANSTGRYMPLFAPQWSKALRMHPSPGMLSLKRRTTSTGI